MGRTIRSYKTVVEHYFNEKYPDYYKNRNKLEKLIINMWQESELDHDKSHETFNEGTY
ncbi:hypothetical protein [Anaerobacillus alkalilacustris]|uniref:hypothetical protein n=1 Tax=Anaerobacillus alkalilacustris TaxID=393763 RepID=UPI001471F2DF|nr:hypothetical protein [Anaerobacillus alkalilacustris]